MADVKQLGLLMPVKDTFGGIDYPEHKKKKFYDIFLRCPSSFEFLKAHKHDGLAESLYMASALVLLKFGKV